MALSAVPFKENKPPSSRADCHLFAKGQALYLLSGINSNGILQDLWKAELIIQPLTLTWTDLKLKSFPQILSFSSCLADNSIFIYGGQTMGSSFQMQTVGDLWKLDLDTLSLEKLDQKGDLPGPRNSTSLVFDKVQNTLLLTGGTDESLKQFDGIYIFKIAQCTWKKVQVLGPQVYKGLWGHSSLITDFQLQAPISKEGPKLVQVFTKEDVNEIYQKSEGRFLTIVGGCSQPTAVYPILTQIEMSSLKVVTVKKILPTCAHRSCIASQGIILRLGGSDGLNCLGASLIGQNQRILKGTKCAIGSGLALLDSLLISFGGGDSEGFHGTSAFNLKFDY